MAPQRAGKMKQLRFSSIISTSPQKKSPAKATKVEKGKTHHGKDDRNDSTAAASVRDPVPEDRQDVATPPAPTREERKVEASKEDAITSSTDATTKTREEASIVASTPYLKKLKREARRLQGCIDSLDPEKDAEQIESYKGDIATLRGFVVACVAQRNMLINDVSGNEVLGKSMQDDQEKIVQRFEEIQQISARVKAARTKRKKKKPATIATEEDPDDGGEVTVKVEGIMGPPRLSANVRTPVSELPKSPTRPLSELVESQERERAAAAAAAAAEQLASVEEDHTSTWAGPLSFCCGGDSVDAAVTSKQPLETIVVRVNKESTVHSPEPDNPQPDLEDLTVEQTPESECFGRSAVIGSCAGGTVDGNGDVAATKTVEPPATGKTEASQAEEPESVADQQSGRVKQGTLVHSLPMFCCGGAILQDDHQAGEEATVDVAPNTLAVAIPTDPTNDEVSYGPSPKAASSTDSKDKWASRSVPHVESVTSETSDVAFDLGAGVVTAVADDAVIPNNNSINTDHGLSLATTGSSDDLDSLDSCLCITDDDDDDEDLFCADNEANSVSEITTRSRRKSNFFTDVWRKWKQPSSSSDEDKASQTRTISDKTPRIESEGEETRASEAKTGNISKGKAIKVAEAKVAKTAQEFLKKKPSTESKTSKTTNAANKEVKRQKPADLTAFLHHVSADEDSVPSHYSTASGNKVPFEIGIQRSYLRNHEMAPMTVGGVMQDLKQTTDDLGRDLREKSENFGEALQGLKNGEWFGKQKALFPSLFSLGSLDSLYSK